MPLALSERMVNKSNPWKWSFIAAVIGVPLSVLAFAGVRGSCRASPRQRLAPRVGRWLVRRPR